MNKPKITTAVHPKLLNLYCKKLLVACVMVACCLSLNGCKKHEPVIESHDDHGLILIGDTHVTLTPKHIASIKSEQYQPSLNLYGQLSPTQQTSIKFDSNIKIKSLLCQKGQLVKKGDVLFTYTILPSLLTSRDIAKPTSEIDANHKDKNLAEQVGTDINNTVKKIGDNLQDIQNNIQNIEEDNPQITTIKSEEVFEYKAPFNGQINPIYYQTNSEVAINSPVLNIQSVNMLKFIGLLPAYTKPRLIIGQHVNLALDDAPEVKGLTGQVSKVVELKNQHKVAVHVQMVENTNQYLPKIGAMVTGRLNYGQLDVGTLVDKSAIHDADLSVFSSPDAHVAAPIKAFVWIVNQDKLLARQSVEVIRFNKKSQQYLVSGIPSDTLVILADLPKDAEGKTLHIS
ncbi:MAG: hypothetical protein CSA42_04235 [Gammaproteobacteria bacterium]|nr:MAG: hypothetical protein CSA42_04235 [Gammaproteobacteria bacterium]